MGRLDPSLVAEIEAAARAKQLICQSGYPSEEKTKR
jgi:hypothetical protein